MKKRRIVVTAALPYANGDIHLGHLLEYLQTDYWVRFQKMCGHECVYICADDTHGTPIMIRARKEGRTPEELIASMWERHFKDFSDFQVAFDNFYSTNSPENRELCHTIYGRLKQNGALFTRSVEQLYCPNCKMFLPDRFVKGTCPKCGATEQYGDSCEHCGSTYGFDELKDAHCATCGCKDLELRAAEHILFDLAKYRDYLQTWLHDHTPADVAKKLLEWFGEDKELLPWDISRDAPYFGFEIPGYKDKFFYVWLDAPVGYMASLKNWCDRHGQAFEDWWQNPDAELYHFIGKDIVRFHCLFWPAMLHASDFKGPTHVNVHGFLTVNGEKMSKSRGTFLNARVYLSHLNATFLRYYYACKINNTTDDIDLNLEDFVQRVNADLVGKITNLASRGAQMLGKRLDGRLGEPDDEGAALIREALSRADALLLTSPDYYGNISDYPALRRICSASASAAISICRFSISDLTMTSASCVAFSLAARETSACFSAAYDSSSAFAACTFSAVTASLSASASFSRSSACVLAISAFALFSPLMASLSASATRTRSSIRAFASPMEPVLFASATEILASLIAFAAASLPSAMM